MKAHTRSRIWALVIVITAVSSKAHAEEVPVNPTESAPTGQQAPDMFAAMRSGVLEVRLIPKNDRESRVLIRNKTKQPLNVQLPAAFAGVPVLAQLPRNGVVNNNNPSGNQGIGGGFGGGGFGGGGGGGIGGGGGQGGGAGFFSVPPERVVQLRVPIVCLEHGKRDPRPGVHYEIRPLENLSSAPGVREVLVQLASGQVNQRSAQAAAWHLANEMNWATLAAKQIEHINAPSEPYFTAAEINDAVNLAQAAKYQVAADKASRADESSSFANR